VNLSTRPWDRADAAKALEKRTSEDLENIEVPPPRGYFRDIRSYLQRVTDSGRTENGVRVLSYLDRENGDAQIEAGPTIFRAPCNGCILFRSGARLSFGITMRLDGSRTRLLSYRFYLHLPVTSGLRFVRIDLNSSRVSDDPLHMPRSHIHPGFEGIHIPFPVMQPLEVLDRIVHVIEPHFTRLSAFGNRCQAVTD
jgi:hypothetical protein